MDDAEKKKKKPPTVYVDGQEYPETPGVMDYVKEGFAPQNTRAQLDVIRRRRQKYGS